MAAGTGTGTGTNGQLTNGVTLYGNLDDKATGQGCSAAQTTLGKLTVGGHVTFNTSHYIQRATEDLNVKGKTLEVMKEKAVGSTTKHIPGQRY